MCEKFKEFNYLLKIDPDLLTKDIKRFKTYKEYKDDWIYEWNENVSWVHEKTWTKIREWTEPAPVVHYCKPFNLKSGYSEWPTCSWKEDGYCNRGNLPGAYIVGNTLRYQDLEWYDALMDSELKDEALKNKAIMEGLIDEDDESSNNGWRRWNSYEIANHDQEEREYENGHKDRERCELFDDHELPVCNIRKFEMIKYSFGNDEEYVAVKEDEYDELTNTSKEAIHAYQEIFRMMDEGWMDLAAKKSMKLVKYQSSGQGITELKQTDLEGPAFEIVKVFHPNVDDSIIRYNVSKPLPLGGPPGQVTIQSDFFFNKDLEYLRYGRKGGRLALSISKMKAAYYPDVGLEQMVPDQMWIEEECKYHIAAIAVRTHMRILSVVRIEVFSLYGYDYMKKIVLRRADLNEHIIAERDFKYLYPTDFKDLQRVEDFQLGIESYQTQLNLTKPRWDATGFEYKHDFTVIDSPRAIIFRDKYGVQMIMRFNEIHKFSDGTLQQIDEALDYKVKEFKVNKMNPGLNTQFWTKKDVDRSKEFMFAIQKRLKTRRILRNLECFVGGRVRERDYRLLQRTE
ncbi:hypothetical protein Tco_0270017 [Tanacetum coccineum]